MARSPRAYRIYREAGYTGMRAFTAYDEVRRAWVAEAGRFEVRLGASSADISQRAWVTLSAEWVEPVSREPTRSTIRA